MIDFRLETFLTLCKIKSYTKAAEVLHITQPAVSQHIKYLEKYYDSKLFNYIGKTLMLTEEGEMLKAFAMTMQASSRKIKIMMGELRISYPIIFGVTLTIAEYTMEPIIARTILEYPEMDITMEVDNTEVLLQKLRDGKIDFAILEGQFDKSDYSSMVFSVERFIPVCSFGSKIRSNTIDFMNIFNERLIIRENGSGTREVFEQALYEQNHTIKSFKDVAKIGNMNLIKELVKKDLGITFLYEQAVKKELEKQELREILIKGFEVKREFNFVFLKDIINKDEYIKWFHYFKSINNEI